jgi:hypothetical protein
VAEILSDPHPIVALGNERNKDGLFEIAPQFIPWDPDGYTGPAGVGVMSQIFDRRGKPVKNASGEVFEVVEIRSADCGMTSSVEGNDRIDSGLIEIDPKSIRWDRSNGFYFGTDGIAVVNQIFDELGQTVNGTDATELGAPDTRVDVGQSE